MLAVAVVDWERIRKILNGIFYIGSRKSGIELEIIHFSLIRVAAVYCTTRPSEVVITRHTCDVRHWTYSRLAAGVNSPKKPDSTVIY